MRRTGIKRKRSKYEDELNQAREAVYYRSGGVCEGFQFALATMGERAMNVYPFTECRVKAQHVHHRKYRSRGGSNDLKNLLHVCYQCHSWIHRNGGFGQPANLMGLALSAEEDE